MYRIGPIGRKSNFHSREKCLIGLVLVTLCFLCFGGIFLLPDNFGGERVLRVYKQIQKAGPEIFIPAPPLAAHASRNEDPHFIGDRQRLQQKIKAELGEILDEPQSNGAVVQAPAPVPAVQQQRQQQEAAAAEDEKLLEPEPDDLAEDALRQQQGAGVHAPIPVIAAPVENGEDAPDAAAAGAAGNVQQQLQLPMGGGGNEQAEPSDASLDEKRLKVKEVSKYKNILPMNL